MVLVVGGTGEWSPTTRLGAVVWPLPGVCSDVNFADVGGGKRPAAALDWTFKRLLSCRWETWCQGLSNIIPSPHNFSKPTVSIGWYLDSNIVSQSILYSIMLWQVSSVKKKIKDENENSTELILKTEEENYACSFDITHAEILSLLCVSLLAILLSKKLSIACFTIMYYSGYRKRWQHLRLGWFCGKSKTDWRSSKAGILAPFLSAFT